MVNLLKCITDPSTEKLVYNDHSLDLEIVAVIDKWLLFRGKVSAA